MRAERLPAPVRIPHAEALFFGLLALAFTPAGLALARAWASLDYQSHGFLIPVLAGWLAYAEQAAHPRLPRVPDRRGAGALMASFLVYALASVVQVVALQGLALVGALAAAVWWLRGLAWLRVLAFPLGYLLFMVPLPPSVVSPVIVRLLAFVSSVSVALLDTFGITVAREGNTLILPSGEAMFVAEACSGLTSLVTILPIAVLVAHLRPMPTRRKLLLVALAVPAAMGANLLRVLATVAGSQRWGAETMTSDPLHTLAGLLVYVVACLLLVAAAGALSTSRRAAGR